MTKKYWQGTPPAKCDMDDVPIVNIFYDAKTTIGPWGCLCPACFVRYGIGLGLGLGQQYEKQPDGKWLKTGD